jgi:hypothetical protein
VTLPVKALGQPRRHRIKRGRHIGAPHINSKERKRGGQK